jgi:hypothetical protein
MGWHEGFHLEPERNLSVDVACSQSTERNPDSKEPPSRFPIFHAFSPQCPTVLLHRSTEPAAGLLSTEI